MNKTTTLVELQILFDLVISIYNIFQIKLKFVPDLESVLVPNAYRQKVQIRHLTLRKRLIQNF